MGVIDKVWLDVKMVFCFWDKDDDCVIIVIFDLVDIREKFVFMKVLLCVMSLCDLIVRKFWGEEIFVVIIKCYEEYLFWNWDLFE